MPSLVQIHAGLADTVRLFTLVVGVWALFNYVRGEGLLPSYWGALVIGELVLAAQAILGAILYVQGGRPPENIRFLEPRLEVPFHFLYGVLVLLVWPGVFAFTEGRDGRREALYYGIAGLFLFGLTLRAISTAR